MNSKQRAFTLVELLTVLAIIAALSALLLPVFRTAKASSQKTTCLSNFHQAGLATSLYLNDFDDRYTPVSYRPGTPPNPANDRTWVQLVLPYLRSFSIFTCPSDTGRTSGSQAAFDQDLVPGDTYARFYSASLRSNIGLNYLYLSPIVRQGSTWVAQPRSFSEVANPSGTILYIDSAWEVVNNQPRGGGRWLVVPPCRYERQGPQTVDTFARQPGESIFYSQVQGWGNSGFGGVWPWHTERANVARVDTGATSFRIRQLSRGCEYEALWQGKITDPASYLWDLR
jgi:prepilin-type N-terminal cleavage/methylation domain-containing protein